MYCLKEKKYFYKIIIVAQCSKSYYKEKILNRTKVIFI